MTAIVVLGMHRSGTSCLAGMLAAAGLASAGEAVRGWDNQRGHHEMLDAVRLNDAVLAHSGGHWLAPVPEVRWTPEHAAVRDRLLSATVAGRPALLKDPRTLLVLPFWRASTVPFRVISIVRHPLSAARSLVAWRGMSLAQGVALWSAHNHALAADHARHGHPLIDFERPRDEVVAQVQAIARAWAPDCDTTALAAAYDEHLVHHDDADAPSVAGLDVAVALYQRLTGRETDATARRRFPHADWAAFTQAVAAGDQVSALARARAACAGLADPAAVLVPAVSALLRRRWYDGAQTLILEVHARVHDGMIGLLLGKVALAAGDAAQAATHLLAACAVPQPFFQARHLLPQALRQAGRAAEARVALMDVVGVALYPHGPLATLAEWAWLDGERQDARRHLAQAISAAPVHRRGRLRTRLAEWLLTCGDHEAARAHLEQALSEDPAYARARDVLESVRRRS